MHWWSFLLLPYFLWSVIIYVVWKLLKWSYQRYQLLQTFRKASIQGPEPNFLFGNIRLIDKQYQWRSLDKWFDQYGHTFGYIRGDRAVLVTKNISLIKQIFIQRIRQFPNRFKMMIQLQPFSSSILALRDDRWRQVRRVLTPAFNATRIKSSVSAGRIIGESVNRLMAILNRPDTKCIGYIRPYDSDGKLMINVNEMSKRFTLDTICHYAFAIDDEDFFRQSPLFNMVEHFFTHNCNTVLVRSAMIFPFMKNVLKFINDHVSSGPIIDHLTGYLQKQINRYEQQQKHCSNIDNDSENIGVRKNLLDFVLHHHHQLNTLSHDEVIGNLLVILMAGYETTACAISFVLFNLARYKEIQDRLRQELIELQNTDNSNSELLDRIIYESMRLYPPVIDYLLRETSDNNECSTYQFELDSQTKTLPNDVAIQVPVWTIHHDPEIWSQPNCFDPDRYGLPTTISMAVNDPKFLAFGLGQRSCIGGSLAMAEIRAIITRLVIDYQIEFNPGQTYPLDSNGLLQVEAHAELIKPLNDIWLDFYRHE
ncbi:cytochrome P450 3A40-like [Dermatophagoides pteronyssinus]|uniref:cytochrome P450 3A40-like n=1 Tax=Dermatophagoides pteronyssinus TaxID=6956 RepID=UPI003F67B7E4